MAFYSLSHRQVVGLLRVIFHAEYVPLPRIVYFVGKIGDFRSSISHPFHTHLEIHPSCVVLVAPPSGRCTQEDTHTHARTHTHTHARARTHTHTHAHTQGTSASPLRGWAAAPHCVEERVCLH